MMQDETMEQSPARYMIKLRYGGYFRLAKYLSSKRYCFGSQKCIYIDTFIYNFDDLIEEVSTHYASDRDLIFSLWFIDKNNNEKSFVKVDSQEKFQVMLSMYEVEKELSVYVTTNNNVETSSMQQRGNGDVDDEESEYSLSDESYHSHYSTDNEVEEEEEEEEDSQMVIYQNISPTMKVKSTFENVKEFRSVLVHYAIMNEFAYYIEKSEPTRVTARCVDMECKWRIHASIMQDKISFEVSVLM